ncbi:hypothetical protein KOR34_35430 [Posidoniimonas corsicana]|uniref:Nickel uptake substrate-specific transmembrane region n=1 Tax=Posidoniimonas corsicana TaxID=1938618 RepID=A0A5C5V6H9_9BACT|nr:carboxypeptidase-like regulatory domain-containing protein [Posidoniimonas corsicana]TWT33710.1 hypothetical protein KOR34_35430 [Posidoniimonas corsicana]
MDRRCPPATLWLPLTAAVVLWPPMCIAEVVDGLLVVHGVVTLSDGSPAPRATVAATASFHEPRRVTNADDQGRYELRGVFGNGLRLHAASADRSEQTVRMIASPEIRLAAEDSVDLRLSPATEQRVQLTAQHGSTAGVLVMASGMGFETHGRTDASGAVTLNVPAEHAVNSIVAWSPDAGVGGSRSPDGAAVRQDALVTLHPVAEHVVRMVDEQGAPVAGVEVAASFKTKKHGWIVTGSVPQANLTSDAQGLVRFPWAPRDGLEYVDCDLVGADWMCYDVDHHTVSDGQTVVHVRRRNLGRPAVGRVHLPGDASPEGLMVAGTSGGPGRRFDIFYSRVEADGSFAYHAPVAMATGMTTVDREWGSEFWTGVVVPWHDADPEPVDLHAYPTIPAIVTVTAGKGRVPQANAWVDFSREVRFPYLQEGELTEPFAMASAWYQTDQDGQAQIPLGHGSNELRVVIDEWSSEKEITVEVDHRDGPINVKFHRP